MFWHRLAGVVALTPTFFCTASAWAQPRPTKSEPTEEPGPSDEHEEPVFERPVVSPDVYPTGCSKREDADVDAAKGLHQAAKAYFAAERYLEAIDAWTESHRFDCTAHRLLINIATAYERLGDVVGARTALAQYLARAPDPLDQVAIDKYEALLAQPVPRRLPPPPPLPAPEDPTTPPPPPTVPLGAWITLGVGAGVAVAGAALLGVGVTQVQGSCPGDHDACTRVERRDAEQGLTFQHAGGALLALGGASTGVAGVWAWRALTPRTAGPDEQAEVSFAISPTGVTLRGRF